MSRNLRAAHGITLPLSTVPCYNTVRKMQGRARYGRTPAYLRGRGNDSAARGGRGAPSSSERAAPLVNKRGTHERRSAHPRCRGGQHPRQEQMGHPVYRFNHDVYGHARLEHRQRGASRDAKGVGRRARPDSMGLIHLPAHHLRRAVGVRQAGRYLRHGSFFPGGRCDLRAGLAFVRHGDHA